MDILRRRLDKNYVIVYSTRMIDGGRPDIRTIKSPANHHVWRVNDTNAHNYTVIMSRVSGYLVTSLYKRYVGSL